MEMGRNIDEILRILKGLQVFDKSQLMPPANWPNNEVVGDKLMVSPSRKLTENEAKRN